MKEKEYIYHGKKLTLRQLAELSGIQGKTLSDRIAKGMSAEEAADTPLRESKSRSKRRVSREGICDAWQNDCFNCQLSECNDNRACRRGEVKEIPLKVGRAIEYNDTTYRVNFKGHNRYWE